MTRDQGSRAGRRLRAGLCFGGTLVLLASVAAAQPRIEPGIEQLLDRFAFREIGPTRPGGRVVAFAVSVADPYVFFVGAGPGGLWKTVNNGTTFVSVFDHEAVASIGDVAIAPSDPRAVRRQARQPAGGRTGCLPVR